MYFTFENPAYLWYFFSIPLLVITHFISLRSAKRKAMKFANFRALKRISGTKLVTKNTTVLLIRMMTVTLLILSASGLKFWYLTEQTDNNYVLAIDVSSSMSAQDYQPSRIEAAKHYAREFISHTERTNKVGIITYSGVTLIRQTPTEEKALTLEAIQDIGTVNSGGTDLPGAIITATNTLLIEPKKGKIIVVFTDGGTSIGNFVDKSIERATQYAQEHNVIIHAVGIGSESAAIGYLPEYYNISSIYVEENLKYITNATGGIYLQSYENDELAEQFSELLGEKNKAYTDINLDYGLLLAALLILFIEWGLLNSKYRKIA